MNKEKFLLLGCIASVIAIVMKVWVPGGGTFWCKAFEICYWLGISFIPGYLVYLLVAYFPTRRDRALLAPFLARESEQICLVVMGLLRDINRCLGANLSMESNENELENAWSKIDRECAGPAIKRTNPIVECTWMEVIFECRQRSIRAIDNIIPYVPYVEADHLRLLTDIRHCHFFACVQNAYYSDGSPNAYSIPARSLHELIQLVVRLDIVLSLRMRGVDFVKLGDYPDSFPSKAKQGA